MAIVLRSDFENVKAQLEDTQESLAAAFARIEVFRQREKLLLAEVSKLRTAQAAAADAAAAAAAVGTAGDGEQQQGNGTASTSAAAAGSTPAAAPPSDAQTPPPPAQQPQQQQHQQQADAFEGPELPCYITEVEGHLPVMLISGSSSGRKTPGSIVITPDYVDFVDVRARIKRHTFIGITAAAAPGRGERGSHSSGKQGGGLKSLKHLLPSCISPREQLPSLTASHPRYPAKPPGGPHLVLSPTPEPSSASGTSTGGAWMAGSAAAAADLQPEAAAVSSSSMSWQQQLHYQDLSPPPPAAAAAAVGGVGSPQSGGSAAAAAAARRASPGAAGAASPLPVRSPRKSSHTSPPEAVLSSTPETPSGWASGSHSLRHWPTWHAGHTAGNAPGPAAETELTATAAAAAAPSTSSAGGGSPRGSSGSSGGWLEGEGGREGRGVWKILWRGGGMQQQLSFEATHTTREVLHRHTLRWLGEADIGTDEISQLAAAAAAAGGDGGGSSSSTTAIAASVAAAAAAGDGGGAHMAVPRHMMPGGYTPKLSEPSYIIQSSGTSSSSSSRRASNGGIGSSGICGSPSIGGISMGQGIGVGASSGGGGRSQSPSAAAAGGSGSQQQQQQQLVAGLAHIAGALPPRYQSRDWQLLYSTTRHGISLQTLFRKAVGQAASVLLVRDGGGYVFGAFCPEVWKPSPRFFGTGETFVFQLAPHKVMWPWKLGSALKNDFFQYAQPDSIGVGGLGAFAIWLDGELLHGSSGACGTFGSPCLSSKEEFKVAALELWGLQ